MIRDSISVCKLINIISTLLLCMCCTPTMLGGEVYTEYLAIVGIAVYGLSLRWIGSEVDVIVGGRDK